MLSAQMLTRTVKTSLENRLSITTTAECIHNWLKKVHIVRYKLSPLGCDEIAANSYVR